MNFNTRISINRRSDNENVGINSDQEEEDDDEDIPNVDNNNIVKEMITIKGEDNNNNV